MSFIHSKRSLGVWLSRAYSANFRLRATCADPFAMSNLCGTSGFKMPVRQFSFLQTNIVQRMGRLKTCKHSEVYFRTMLSTCMSDSEIILEGPHHVANTDFRLQG